MNESIVNTGPLNVLLDELKASAEHHEKRYRDDVVDLMHQVEKEYGRQLQNVLSILVRNKELSGILEPFYNVLESYLSSMLWVGWGDCEFGPPLKIRPVGEFAPGILVYLSARLIDDGIDGHKDYKGRVQSFYGFLANRMEEREAAGLSSMMGNLVLNMSLRLLLKEGYAESVDLLMSTYSTVISGALAETLFKASDNLDIYHSIVKGKSVAYDMMLHQVFLRPVEPGIRLPLLQLLAEFSEVAQWLNDLCDEEDDRFRNQLNILRFPGMNRYSVFAMIAHSLNRLWRNCGNFSPDLRNTIAARFKEPVQSLIQLAPTL